MPSIGWAEPRLWIWHPILTRRFGNQGYGHISISTCLQVQRSCLGLVFTTVRRGKRGHWKFHCARAALRRLQRRLLHPRLIDAGSESRSFLVAAHWEITPILPIWGYYPIGDYGTLRKEWCHTVRTEFRVRCQSVTSTGRIRMHPRMIVNLTFFTLCTVRLAAQASVPTVQSPTETPRTPTSCT